MPSDTMPSDTMPSDTMPSDTMPADTMPSDTMPSVHNSLLPVARKHFFKTEKASEFLKILRKCFLCTTCILRSVASSTA